MPSSWCRLEAIAAKKPATAARMASDPLMTGALPKSKLRVRREQIHKACGVAGIDNRKHMLPPRTIGLKVCLGYGSNVHWKTASICFVRLRSSAIIMPCSKLAASIALQSV